MYRINPKNVKGVDVDLTHVIALCIALADFKITKEVYDKLPQMFKSYFVDEK